MTERQQIEAMKQTCGELRAKITTMEAERAAVMEVLNRAQYMPVGLRSQVVDSYTGKIRSRVQELKDIKERLDYLQGIQ